MPPLAPVLQVLGLLLQTTLNPKTQTVDYAKVDMDLVSVAAVNQGVVKASMDGQHLQSRQHVLPLYITPQHWARVVAGQGLPQVLRTLCPELRFGATRPDAWLQAMPKLLNTAIVLLMDKVQAHTAACWC